MLNAKCAGFAKVNGNYHYTVCLLRSVSFKEFLMRYESLCTCITISYCRQLAIVI